MKNKINAIINFSRFLAILCLLIVFGCKDEAWDDHYEAVDSRLESNILTVLSQDPEFATFLNYIYQTGYNEQLETTQAFTVWAPTNDAFNLVPSNILNNPDLLKELIGNHISLFSYNASNQEEVLVKMFNNKYVEFLNTTGGSTFGGVNVVESDILASNGIVHSISSVLEVNPNIWGYLNENSDQFPTLMTFLEQFNETAFDEENSVEIGTNTLGQTVYDSIFSTTNSYFKTIGDLSLEESRYTFIGLTEDIYTDAFDIFDDYYYYPIADTVKNNTDKAIFKNLTYDLVDVSELNGSKITSTTGGELLLNASDVDEEIELSNGNLLFVNQLNFDPIDVIYKPIRYEVENTERRTIGSLTDFSIQKNYDAFASEQFTNTITLLRNPDGNDGNNYFEVAFTNVLSASYKINAKFTPVGAAQSTKLKFELRYIGSNFLPVVEEIGPIVVSNLEDGVISIGDEYDFTFFVNEDIDNYFHVNLRVIVDVSEPELLLYDRSFGLDYVELVPTE